MRMLASHHSIILYKLPSFYIYFNLAQSNMDFGSLSFVTWFHSICVHSAWICVPKMQSLSLFPSAYHMYVVHCNERQPTNPISLQRIYKQFHAHCTHTQQTHFGNVENLAGRAKNCIEYSLCVANPFYPTL